jgi:hypothetical protein
VESGYCVVFGVSNLSDKILSMASSSACSVAYTDPGLSIDHFKRDNYLSLHYKIHLFCFLLLLSVFRLLRIYSRLELRRRLMPLRPKEKRFSNCLKL